MSDETCGHTPVPGIRCGLTAGHDKTWGHATGTEETATSWPDGPDCRDAGNTDAYLTEGGTGR